MCVCVPETVETEGIVLDIIIFDEILLRDVGAILAALVACLLAAVCRKGHYMHFN